MSKFYHHVTGRTKINTCSGQNAIFPIEFRKNSALIISRNSFIQSQIQRIIFNTHGPKILEANTFLTKNPSPRSRMEFLCSTPYGVDDQILSKVFEYSQSIFREVYSLRNILAHENWMSCADYSNKVLFSKIEEEARLLKVSGRLKYDESNTSREVFEAIVRYISKIKIIGCENLQDALQDIHLCEWMLMTIDHILNEEDREKRDDLKSAFLIFNGTSHLFEKSHGASPSVQVNSFNRHEISR